MVASRRKTMRRRRKTAVTDKRIARVAKKVVDSKLDYKDFFTSIAASSLGGFGLTVTAFPTTHDPSNIGTTIRTNQQDSARTGTTCHIKKIEIGFHISPGTGIAQATARLMLVRFPRNMNTTINPIEILQFSNTPEAQVSMKQEDSAYQILYDKRFSYGNQTHSSLPNNLKHTIRFKNPPLVKYVESATTGTAADIVTGLMRWFLVVTDSTGTYGFIQKVTFFEQ